MARRQRILPACRTEGDVFDIPRFALDPGDVKGFMDELYGFHRRFTRAASHQRRFLSVPSAGSKKAAPWPPASGHGPSTI
jgi:hypothetical protein